MKSKRPKLRIRDLVILSASFMTPAGVALVIGGTSVMADGAPASAFTIAALAILFTAASYKKLIEDYPYAGSVYIYAGRGVNRYAGFLTGWTALLFYLLAAGSAIIVSARLMGSMAGFPYMLSVIIIVIIALAANIFGPKICARVCLVLFILGLAAVLIYILVCMMAAGRGTGVGSAFSTVPFTNGGKGFRPVFAGAGVAGFAFLGFESISTLAEDMPEGSGKASRAYKIGKALIVSCLIMAVLYILQAYASGIVLRPEPGQPYGISMMDAAGKAGGPPMRGIYTFAMLLAGPLVAITAMSAAARLMQAMGRTGDLPAKVFARKRWGRAGVPPYNLLICAAVMIILGLLKSQLNMITELMRFSGLLCFVAVNLLVLWIYWFSGKERKILKTLVIPTAGMLITFYMWTGVEIIAFSEGLIWIAAGIGVLGLNYKLKYKPRVRLEHPRAPLEHPRVPPVIASEAKQSSAKTQE
jgi:putrescine importer